VDVPVLTAENHPGSVIKVGEVGRWVTGRLGGAGQLGQVTVSPIRVLGGAQPQFVDVLVLAAVDDPGGVIEVGEVSRWVTGRLGGVGEFGQVGKLPRRPSAPPPL